MLSKCAAIPAGDGQESMTAGDESCKDSSGTKEGPGAFATASCLRALHQTRGAAAACSASISSKDSNEPKTVSTLRGCTGVVHKTQVFWPKLRGLKCTENLHSRKQCVTYACCVIYVAESGRTIEFEAHTQREIIAF